MKQALVYGAIALCLFVSVARSDVYSDDVTDFDPLDLGQEDASNVTSSRVERQAGPAPAAAAVIGGYPGGAPIGGGFPGGYPGGYPGGGYPGGGYPGGGYPGGGYPGGGYYPSPGYPQTNWWDPCETPLSCPRCRDLQLNGNDPWWCLDICLNRLPKWCFCWV